MILRSSALLAIALDEPEREAFVAKINAAQSVAVAAVTLVEAGIVLSSRLGDDAGDLLAERHPAGLNLGDCLAYATAKMANEPLLATGDDFPQTDIQLA